MDLHRKQFSIDVAGESLTVEVSRVAEQASAAVIGRYGGVAVLTTVVMGKEDKDMDYFPLTVQYEERFYAAGKILGSRYMRREGRPSDQAVLSGRIVDRTIRPLFDHRMRREVQVVSTVLSIDGVHNPEFVALMTASLALAISEVPWGGPVAAIEARKTRENAELAWNPPQREFTAEDEFEAFIAGTRDRISMIELEGVDASEEAISGAFREAAKEIARLVAWQEGIVKEIGKRKMEIAFPGHHDELKKKIKTFIEGKLEAAVYAKEKVRREEQVRELRNALRSHLVEGGATDKERKAAEHLFEKEIDALVHEQALSADCRPDGRGLAEVRELHGEVGLFPRVHGSALFVRGNTQAMAMVTLAPPGQELLVESMSFSGKRRFLLHYNFPPYSVGETGPFRGPGRREIGHGALAYKALRNLVPDSGDFPYAVRVVSEILSSNGSSSMATVCATSLALMDAGVPLKKPVAGIAMGLMTESQTNADFTQTNAEKSPRGSASSPRESAPLKYKILTDIQGPEDHYGDMDCKVAGTRDGVTAIQMDVKINGLTPDLLGEVLSHARAARIHILDAMARVLPEPRPQISKYAPVILTTSIPPEKIGELIGPGGKMINGIIERTGVLSIDVDEDGTVFISVEGDGGLAKANVALAEVNAIGKEYTIGEIVEGPIVRIMEFGAIVDLGGGKDGMIHVSELKSGFVKKVDDVVHLGDRVRAKIIRVEDGRIGLSLKALNRN